MIRIKILLPLTLLSILMLLTGCSSEPTKPFPPPTVTATETVTTTIISTQTSAPNPTTSLVPALTLSQFLEDNFSFCQTSIGPTRFTFNIYENDSILSPYDYWIMVEYDFNFFYDLRYSISITTEMNHTVCQELKNHQENLARAVTAFMPNKKFYGGYHYSWYKYPTLQLELQVRRYYSWTNYQPQSILTKYEEAFISDFSWYNLIDDELTR